MASLTKNHAQLTAEVARHIEADLVKQKSYKTCFIGCLAHQQDDPQYIEDTYGIPLVLTRILEAIFEQVAAQEAVELFAAFPAAVAKDGKDLTTVPWKFLVSILKELPQQPQEIQEVIDPVIAGLSLLAEGKEWAIEDALAASNAINDINDAWAARTTRAAAWVARHVVAGAAADGVWVTSALADVPIECQKDIILRLITEA
jgi:hypothetical protein